MFEKNFITIFLLKKKVFKSTNVPILWVSPKYPKQEIVHKSVFVPLTTPFPYYFSNSSDCIDNPPNLDKSVSINEIINQALERSKKLSYHFYTLPDCPTIGKFFFLTNLN